MQISMQNVKSSNFLIFEAKGTVSKMSDRTAGTATSIACANIAFIK